MLEKEIEKKCVDWLKTQKILAIKVALIRGAGFPDRTLLKDGKAVFIEFKTSKGKQTALQKLWQEKLEKLGFKYYVCRCIGEVKQVVKNEYA